MPIALRLERPVLASMSIYLRTRNVLPLHNLSRVSKGNQGGAKEGGLNIGQYEGLHMQTTESKILANQLVLTTPIPGDPLSSL